MKYIVEKVVDPALLDFSERFLKPTNGILAGGALRAALSWDDNDAMSVNLSPNNPEIKDYDIFFRSEEDYNNASHNLMRTGKSVKEKYSTENSSSFLVYYDDDVEDKNSSTTWKGFVTQITVDFVKKFCGNPEVILDEFDFTITQCAMYRENGETYLMFHENFKKHLKNRVLEYVDVPEKSRNVIDRMLQYNSSYGYIPSRGTTRKCLRSFCDSFEELKNVDVDQLLENEDFQKYAGGEKSKVYHPLWRKKSKGVNVAIQEDDLIFVKYLLAYWYYTAKVDNLSVAHFGNKYDESFNMAKLIQQMSEGYTHRKVQERCEMLAKKFSLSLSPDTESDERLVFVESSYSLMRLLEFFDENVDELGVEKIHQFLTNFLSCRFVPQRSVQYVKCLVCGKLINKNECDCDEVHFLLELESYVVLKALAMNNNTKWWSDCLDFFDEIYHAKLSRVPTLSQWHDFLDNRLLNPSVMPSLQFSMMIEE